MRLKDWVTDQKDQRAIAYGPETAALYGLTEPPAKSGMVVNEQTALGLSTVYRACTVISQTIGGMPFTVFDSTPDVREEAKSHPLYPLLRVEPNPDQSAVDFWGQQQFWACLFNNSFVEIVRDGSGRAAQLWGIHPGNVRIDYTRSGTKVFKVWNPDGSETEIATENIIHVRGPSLDSSAGCRLVSLARESLGFTMAADRFGSAFFGNGTRLGGVLESPGGMSDQARENLRRSWQSSYQGVNNAGKTPLLEEGVKFVPFEISNEAGQYDETRQFQVYEVCRWMGVDPIFLYEYGRATWNNGSIQLLNFLQFTLNPWLLKWESEINRKCLPKSERGKYFAEFERDQILSMDHKGQAEVWQIGVQNGWYSAEEIRKWQNLKPLPKNPEPVQLPPTTQEQNGEA